MPRFSPSNQGFYLDPEIDPETGEATEIYRVLPDDLVPITNDQHREMLAAINLDRQQFKLIDGKLVPEDQPIVVTWDMIRIQRTKLLGASDYTQTLDYPEAKRLAWAAYRAELRDIPETFATPEEVVWPSPPR